MPVDVSFMTLTVADGGLGRVKLPPAARERRPDASVASGPPGLEARLAGRSVAAGDDTSPLYARRP
jgi:hypothetical protein